MLKKVISDSTVIIAFSSIDKLEILKSLYEEIVISEEVSKELSKGKPGSDYHKYTWIKKITLQEPRMRDYLMLNLDVGEADTIALAEELNVDLVMIDDFFRKKNYTIPKA